MGDTKHVERNTSLTFSGTSEKDMNHNLMGHNGPPIDELPIAQDAYEKLVQLTVKHYRGPTDTWTAARERTASRIGLSHSYAKRIWQRWRVMSDVSGREYRRITKAYNTLCSRIEASAAHEAALADALKAGLQAEPRKPNYGGTSDNSNTPVVD